MAWSARSASRRRCTRPPAYGQPKRRWRSDAWCNGRRRVASAFVAAYSLRTGQLRTHGSEFGVLCNRRLEHRHIFDDRLDNLAQRLEHVRDWSPSINGGECMLRGESPEFSEQARLMLHKVPVH